MPIVFYGIDNEFAASTGDNVNTTPNSSTFDDPPNGSRNLVITSNQGDNDPRLFELGDSYDVSWDGSRGGGFLENAVVIRSDMSPDGEGGIVVFEGLHENGEAAQIIWTPDFDLAGWFIDNYNPSNEPQFYTEDTQSGFSHCVVCFAAETRVETPNGFRRVDRLQIGDLVTTQDGGARPVRWLAHSNRPGVGTAAPVLFEKGALGNGRAIRVSQQQRMVVRSAKAHALYGQAEVMVPAKAFLTSGTARKTARLARCGSMTYVHVLLDQHHILCAEGAASESLYLGPQAKHMLLPVSAGCDALRGIMHMTPARPLLTVRQGRELLAGPSAAIPAPRPERMCQLV